MTISNVLDSRRRFFNNYLRIRHSRSLHILSITFPESERRTADKHKLPHAETVFVLVTCLPTTNRGSSTLHVVIGMRSSHKWCSELCGALLIVRLGNIAPLSESTAFVSSSHWRRLGQRFGRTRSAR